MFPRFIDGKGVGLGGAMGVVSLGTFAAILKWKWSVVPAVLGGTVPALVYRMVL